MLVGSATTVTIPTLEAACVSVISVNVISPLTSACAVSPSAVFGVYVAVTVTVFSVSVT